MNSPATTLKIPSTLSTAFSEGRRAADFQRWALETLVLAAVGDNLVSTGQAAELLGLGYFETLAWIKEKGVPHKMSEEEFDLDQADLQRISAAIDRR